MRIFDWFKKWFKKKDEGAFVCSSCESSVVDLDPPKPEPVTEDLDAAFDALINRIEEEECPDFPVPTFHEHDLEELHVDPPVLIPEYVEPPPSYDGMLVEPSIKTAPSYEEISAALKEKFAMPVKVESEVEAPVPPAKKPRKKKAPVKKTAPKKTAKKAPKKKSSR